VVAADFAEFFSAVTLRPDAVPEFVGAVFDLAREHPEHQRMVTWAQLEGVTLDAPGLLAVRASGVRVSRMALGYTVISSGGTGRDMSRSRSATLASSCAPTLAISGLPKLPNLLEGWSMLNCTPPEVDS
jgi:Tetracyclin repressor-like, C-terminal domain